MGACHGLLGGWKRSKHEYPGLLQAYQRIDEATLDTEQRVVLSRILRTFAWVAFNWVALNEPNCARPKPP